MAETIEIQQSVASSEPLTETLLEFLYLTPVGIVKFQPDGTIDIANPVTAALLIPLAPASDMSDLYRVLSAVTPDLRDRIAGFQAVAGSICDQLQVAVPNTPTVLTLRIIKINPDIFMAVIQDITRAIEQETQIRDDQQRFRAIVENVRDYAIYTVNLDGRVDNWNPPCRCAHRRVGSRGCRRGADWHLLPDRGRKPGSISVAARSGASVRRSGIRGMAGPQGREPISGAIPSRLRLPDRFGRPSGFVLVSRDLTERKHMEDRLVALSITDPMTGAFNRRAAETKLEDVYRGWRRYGRMFSLLMIDCDHFKKINDTWGHDVGDTVLVTLVRICRDSFRESDAIFRWGGEEFLILLPETRQDFGRVAAERLRLALEAAEITHKVCAIRITVSIGVPEVCAADRYAGRRNPPC